MLMRAGTETRASRNGHPPIEDYTIMGSCETHSFNTIRDGNPRREQVLGSRDAGSNAWTPSGASEHLAGE
jgi:hypothetical protein